MEKSALRLALVLAALFLAVPFASSSADLGPRSSKPDGDGGAAYPLIDLAKAHLGKLLGVPTAEIIWQSATPLAFPRPTGEPAETSAEIVRKSSGFAIVLATNGLAYEYHGRAMGTLYILWREL